MTERETKMIYDDNFNIALGAFDAVLDRLAKIAREGSNGRRCFGVSVNPLDGNCQVSTVEPQVVSRPNLRKAIDDVYGMKFVNLLDDIRQVIFNDPATIVIFSDGSKVCVKACDKDKFNKETGLMYALVKRLYANDVDDNGYLRSKGLGEKINKVIENATDQQEVERVRRRKQKQAKKIAAQKADEEKAKLANEVSEQAAKEAVDQIYDEKKDNQ